MELRFEQLLVKKCPYYRGHKSQQLHSFTTLVTEEHFEARSLVIIIRYPLVAGY